MRIANYIREFHRQIAPFLMKKLPKMITHRCCIRISPKEISLIHIEKTNNQIKLFMAESIAYDGASNLLLVLVDIVNKHKLQFIPVYWLLSPEDYQIFLIESLPVKPEEFRDALGWHIKSLISYPLEEAVLDYFKLPAKTAQNNHMVAAVVARKSHLAKMAGIFHESGLSLTAIDIPELALRNLSALYEIDEKSTAFIYFNERLAILNITHDKHLYFTRHINLTITNEFQDKDYEQFGLDILRYFDYYQSQWRHPNPGRIFVASEKRNAVEMASFLSDYLLVSVEPFSLKPLDIDRTKVDLLEKKYLLTLGCALREEERDVKTGN